MVRIRHSVKRKSLHISKRHYASRKKRAKLQFWVWKKRKEAGLLGASRAKQQVLVKFFSPLPLKLSKTNRATRINKTTESPEVTMSPVWQVNGIGTSEKKEDQCQVNCKSSDYVVPTVLSCPNDFKSERCNSLSIVNTVVLEQNSTADVFFVKEDISIEKKLQEFLNDFHTKYGSFIPLQKSDLLKLLKDEPHNNCKDFEILILEMTIELISKIIYKMPNFEVKYKKHKLTLDDLSTLASENWLNDQVINMYGELLMDVWRHPKIHFLNSFFYRQLLTKGYEGVKRWTKQVELFSKHLLLVPVHLEVHWCLVTVDFIKKKVTLYDSQLLGLYQVAQNILNYLVNEAKEKKHTAFQAEWILSVAEKIPQQTTENDCGVFVLEYSRCLSLSKAMLFSQKEIPKIRKRIYKELCEHKLHDTY